MRRLAAILCGLVLSGCAFDPEYAPLRPGETLVVYPDGSTEKIGPPRDVAEPKENPWAAYDIDLRKLPMPEMK